MTRTPVAQPAQRRVFLHLGMHKTGTTTIQTACDGYDDGARRYLRLQSNANHTNALAMVYGRLPKAAPRRAQSRAAQQVLIGDTHRDWMAALCAPGDLIVSGEGLTTQLARPQDVDAIVADIRSGGAEPLARAYIRGPEGFLRSVMAQLMKTGQPFLDPKRYWPHYRKRFAPWRAALGRDGLRLVPYDPQALRGRALLEDFAGWSGIQVSRLPEASRILNRSPSADALALIDRVLGRGGAPSAAETIVALKGFGRGVAVPDPRRVRTLMAEQAGDVAWMEQALGCDLPRESMPEDAVVFDTEAAVTARARAALPAALDWVPRGRVRTALRDLARDL